MNDPTISFLRHNYPKPPCTGKFAISESGFVSKTDENAVGEVAYIDGRYVIVIQKYDDALIEKVCRCFNLKRDKVRVLQRSFR